VTVKLRGLAAREIAGTLFPLAITPLVLANVPPQIYSTFRSICETQIFAELMFRPWKDRKIENPNKPSDSEFMPLVLAQLVLSIFIYINFHGSESIFIDLSVILTIFIMVMARVTYLSAEYSLLTQTSSAGFVGLMYANFALLIVLMANSVLAFITYDWLWIVIIGGISHLITLWAYRKHIPKLSIEFKKEVLFHPDERNFISIIDYLISRAGLSIIYLFSGTESNIFVPSFFLNLALYDTVNRIVCDGVLLKIMNQKLALLSLFTIVGPIVGFLCMLLYGEIHLGFESRYTFAEYKFVFIFFYMLISVECFFLVRYYSRI